MATVYWAPTTCPILAEHLRHITPYRPANVTISGLTAEETSSGRVCHTCLSCTASDVLSCTASCTARAWFGVWLFPFKSLCSLHHVCILPSRVSGKGLHSPFSTFGPWGPLKGGLVAKFQTAPSLAQEALFPGWVQRLGGHPGVWLHLRSQRPRICTLPVPLLPARQPGGHVALDRRCSAPDPLSGRKCN